MKNIQARSAQLLSQVRQPWGPAWAASLPVPLSEVLSQGLCCFIPIRAGLLVQWGWCSGLSQCSGRQEVAVGVTEGSEKPFRVVCPAQHHFE